jgi:hypothetical protein
MRAYGKSHVVLETVLSGPQPIPEYYKSWRVFVKLLLSILLVESKKSVRFAIAMVAYHLGVRQEHFAQHSRTDS